MKQVRTLMLRALVGALAALLACGAVAEGALSFDGTVKAAYSLGVLAPIGGTAGEIQWIAGQRIEKGDEVLALSSTKVLATQSGKVTGVFAKAGDSIEIAEARYGAVLYVEPDLSFTISATTDKAYDTGDNKFIHIGETVFLSGVSNTTHTGEGIVTAVSGSSYTVEVTKPDEFSMDETVNIFRDAKLGAKTRIGRGDISRVDPTAYAGEGSVYAMRVSNGDHVNAGDVLYETLPGTYDGLYATGNVITCDVSGIIESVNTAEGSSVSKGDSVISVYPDGSLYVEISISETDIAYVSEGDTVEIEFTWNEDEGAKARGTVTFLSFVSSSGDDTASYTARVRFDADDSVRIGMTCVVYTLDEEDAKPLASARTAAETAEKATGGEADPS